MNQEQDVLLEPDNPRLMPDSGRPPRAATPDTCKPAPPRPVAKSRAYLPVRLKFTIALLAGLAWAAVSIRLSLPWLDDLALLVGRPAAIFIIAFIAYVPGFMNAFLICTILLDRRPERKIPAYYPGVTVLVACYNESAQIAQTIISLARQGYPGAMSVLILDDGSTDDSVARANAAIAQCPLQEGHSIRVIRGATNVGKAGVLRRGLAQAEHELIVTIDGDSWVYTDAIQRIVERYLADPPGTRAVAGSVLARNSRQNWLTRVQEWDYFHGIAAVKRMQSMYHGTLVAQGAFSLYDRQALVEAGGWPDCVGEDIVVSWAFLERGHRIGYCEDAIVFTNVPDRLRQFAQQRKRWSRGLIEAFKSHPKLLHKRRMSLLFIWWNVLFLPLDLVYTFVFIPGVIAAVFGHYYIVGIMTLLVLPLAVLWNGFIYRVQRRMFKRQDLRIRRNPLGFLVYMLVYSMILQPICVWGYVSELAGLRKNWGTK
ncbi:MULTISPECIES: glycosyltransferase family 2 protein [Lysobacter]|jgi:biofilm PGA synthesis N-glycosyltransferase PgaC|uniref:glycosyltransferase n=1 Tax=Lysobacteraceae TaxID=32033 RepID=UPI001CD18ADE|nr:MULTISPECIES: glycosyltransferase family 2 protein [Lysobacter]